MISSKNKVLRSILDSKKGLHLTTYIKFDGNILRFRKKLNSLIKTAEQHLSDVLSPEDKKYFLNPIRELAFNSENLKQIKGNIAIFRKNDFFRYVSLPLDIEDSCTVADTFHIKPLIKWAQLDQDFLIVGLSPDGATLYKGSQSEFRKLDVAIYPEYLKKLDREGGYASSKQKGLRREEIEATMLWLASWVDDLVKGNETTIFVAGGKDHVSSFIKNLKSDKLYPETIAPHFSPNNIYELCKNVRAILKIDSHNQFNETLKEFEIAQKINAAQSNLFKIAKAAARGKVRKLVIAEDLNVFGKLDFNTGALTIHAADIDHEDDCLLDDLAQIVLLGGGEVVVAKRSEIPKGKLVVAVMNTQQSDLAAELMGFGTESQLTG